MVTALPGIYPAGYPLLTAINCIKLTIWFLIPSTTNSCSQGIGHLCSSRTILSHLLTIWMRLHFLITSTTRQGLLMQCDYNKRSSSLLTENVNVALRYLGYLTLWRMREGYGNRSVYVCVCLSVTKLIGTCLVYMLKTRSPSHGIFNLCIVWISLKMLFSSWQALDG